MSQFFTDYIWKNGKPYGTTKTMEEKDKIAYKIISDPYYKRISIEKYNKGFFDRIIYDSAIFDFRHLNLAEQAAWQKITIQDSDAIMICHIRNHDDRLILIEEYTFEKHFCRECRSFSPHGVHVSSQKIFYTSLNDPFNGSILYDAGDRQIMKKTYDIDPLTEQFSTLLTEQWGG